MVIHSDLKKQKSGSKNNYFFTSGGALFNCYMVQFSLDKNTITGNQTDFAIDLFENNYLGIFASQGTPVWHFPQP